MATCLVFVLSYQCRAGDWQTIDDGTRRPILSFSGAVEPGETVRLQQKMAEAPDAAAVVLNSPGGSLDEGIQLAVMIDELGLDTLVIAGASCESACSIAFMGGHRRIAQSGAVVGVHAPFRQEDTGLLPDPENMVSRNIINNRVRKELTEFAQHKGIAKTVVDWMFISASPMFSKKISIEEGLQTGYFTDVLASG